MPHYINENLAVVVIGASGDLAKRNTYPSLFKLFIGNSRRKKVPKKSSSLLKNQPLA
jgi:glucose-6-phosphate 1-dehydrogenase